MTVGGGEPAVGGGQGWAVRRWNQGPAAGGGLSLATGENDETGYEAGAGGGGSSDGDRRRRGRWQGRGTRRRHLGKDKGEVRSLGGVGGWGLICAVDPFRQVSEAR
uniref:Uncharacterized protein n=1 Tax=Oryza glaberrima TaxID=4538 RepID=A0A679BB44_ORYGL|nr:hypothetical protein [Oryza glaberrima]